MIHNKKQQLLFFTVLENLIKEKLFLPKIIDKLRKGIDQKTRIEIYKKAKTGTIEGTLNEIKIIGLFYCLHIQKPRNSHISMFTKKLISDTRIDFDPENLKEINNKLKKTIESIGLPSLEGTTKRFVQNLYYFEPDFLEKYPKMHVDLDI